jgi:hypothetical protein
MPPGRNTNLYNKIASLQPSTKIFHEVPEGEDVRFVQQNIHHGMRRRNIKVHTTIVGRTVHITRL